MNEGEDRLCKSLARVKYALNTEDRICFRHLYEHLEGPQVVLDLRKRGAWVVWVLWLC